MVTSELTTCQPVDALTGMSPFGLTFGRIFDDWFSNRADGERSVAPLVDVHEDANALVLTAEVPGIQKEDLRIQIENGLLMISGEKRDERETKDASFLRTERRFGAFQRTLALPPGVDTNTVDAQLNDGVLTVRLPKREEVKPRLVKVK